MNIFEKPEAVRRLQAQEYYNRMVKYMEKKWPGAVSFHVDLSYGFHAVAIVPGSGQFNPSFNDWGYEPLDYEERKLLGLPEKFVLVRRADGAWIPEVD